MWNSKEMCGLIRKVPTGSNNVSWMMMTDPFSYRHGEASSTDSLETDFAVPVDAQSGDYFNIIMEVKDKADAPFTRYAQVIVATE